MIQLISRWLTRKSEARRKRLEALMIYREDEERRQNLIADESLNPLERLISWWGIDAQPSALEADICKLEQRCDVRLPNDFRRYLMLLPAGNDWDQEGTNWWPLSAIKSVAEECGPDIATNMNADKQLIFADYMVSSYTWAVDCSGGTDHGKVILVGGLQDHIVADTFDSFLDLYVRDHWDLHR